MKSAARLSSPVIPSSDSNALDPAIDYSTGPTSAHMIRVSRLIVGGWFTFAVAHAALAQLGGADSTTAIHFAITSIAGVCISLSLGLVALLRKDSRFSIEVVIAVSVSAGGMLWFIDVFVQAWPAGYHLTLGWPADFFMNLRLNAIYFCVLFFLQGIGCELFNSTDALQKRERQLLEARLAALRFQLNPHFVFNTLNAVSTLVADGQSQQAEEIIGRLSDFLRQSLEQEPTELVSLASEIDLMQTYLAIEAVRFRDRLVVRFACAPGLADAQVPSFILQPLVENAVKYGVSPSKGQVTIVLEATTNGEDLILVVENDGLNLVTGTTTTPSTGVGLANIAARLEAIYGTSGRIDAERREHGFTATIRMPLCNVDK
jgi:signal transduction histidine kinase